MLPPSIPNDDLIAKCSPRGWGNVGSVVWCSYFAAYDPPAPKEVPKPFSANKPAMAYKMEHYMSRKHSHRTIDSIVVTNLYCGHGKGWDIVVDGKIRNHFGRKSEAQGEAEKLLEGQC